MIFRLVLTHLAFALSAGLAGFWLRGRVDRQIEKARLARMTVDALTTKRWVVEGVEMPDPNDAQWTTQLTNYVGSADIVMVLVMGAVRVDFDGNVYISHGGPTTKSELSKAALAYGREVVRCFRQRQVDKTKGSP